MDLGVTGRKALVTGASRGIGQAVALALAREGCRVQMVARRSGELKALVDRMGGREQGHGFYAADLLCEGIPRKVVEALSPDDDPVDIVIHNVGGTLGVKNVLSPLSEWLRVWMFNVGIAIEMNGLIVPAMTKRRWGRIVHISSISSESLRGSAPYASAKLFLHGYVKGLGRAVAQDGIVVTAILPGAIWSEGGHWDVVGRDNPQMLGDFLRHHHAIGRLGTAEEIASFAVFLSGQQATFACGSLVPVDGGTM